MKVLVSGGAGFIGSHLVDRLVNDGHEVAIIDDLSRGKRENLNKMALFCQCDIGSPDATGHIMAFRPEIIFHEAAQIDVRTSVAQPVHDTIINVAGTVNILSAATAAGARRVIFASSGGAIYGDTDVLPTPESHATNPESPYGAAKLCGEIYGRLFTRLHGLEFVALRYGNVYGPRQDPHGEAGVVAIFSQRFLNGQSVTINGEGRQTRDYVYVGDVVAANVAAIGAPVGAYNIGTGIEVDVNELCMNIARACGVEANPLHGPARAGEQQKSCLDISLAKSQLGWGPGTPLARGLELTAAYFRQTTTV